MPGDIDQIRSELEKIQSLPTLPVIATKLLNMIDQENVSMTEVSKVIVVDPALTSRVLKIANSAYYGVRNHIDTIKLALVVLGIAEIRNVLLSVSLFRTFNDVDEEESFDQNAFWRHSIAVAHLAKKFARDFRIRTHGEEFTAGLIHDIGKIIIAQYFSYTLPDIHEAMQGKPNYEAEEQVLGLSHMDIGAWLAEKWKIPEHLTETIRFHHHPHLVMQNPLLSHLVCLADAAANCCGMGEIPILREQVLAHPSWECIIGQSGLSTQVDLAAYLDTLDGESDEVDKYLAIAFE